MLAEYYFTLGKFHFRGRVPSEFGLNDLEGSNENLENAFFEIYTAAALGHKTARAYLALILDNGLIPSGSIIKEQISEGGNY